MIVVKSRYNNFDFLIGKQSVNSDVKYRKLDFCVVREVDGDFVALNGLSGEMVKLSAKEAELLRNDCVVPCKEAEELIENWYLVPEEHDDMLLCEEYRLFVRSTEKFSGYSCYTVMTTTDCNARCFYCYEKGANRVHMSEKTAETVADFIVQTRDKSKKVYFDWYGGEPLYNKSVIDLICGRMEKEGIEYSGVLITNGYLLDEDTLRKAIDFWHIDKIQITIDGTEEVYNRSKAYIYDDGRSPYQVVLDNLERVLQNGVKTLVRLNMDRHNQSDLLKLVDILAERFGEYKKVLFVYPALIFEQDGAGRPNHTAEDRMELAKNFMSLWDYCIKAGFLNEKGLGKRVKTNRCTSDTFGYVMITPWGKLGKCDHYTETDFIGDIYNGVTDNERVMAQFERANTPELCAGCAVYPRCIKLKKCPGEGYYICDEAKRYIAIEKLNRSIDAAYRKIVAKN